MSSLDVTSQEKDELTDSERSSAESSLADDIEEDSEVSTTQSDDSSIFNEYTKVDIHATIQMQVKETTLLFQHRFEYDRNKTLKKLVDHLNKQLELDKYARPSVEVKAREVRKAYNEYRTTLISDLIDNESTMELNLNIDYSECPRVFWEFIHNLAMRTAQGSEHERESSADEVLQVAIANYDKTKFGYSKTFDKDFECFSTALTIDHLNILVPALIQILQERYNVVCDTFDHEYTKLDRFNKRQARRVLLHITKNHGNSLNQFALQLSELVRRLFLSCEIKNFSLKGYIDSDDCEFAAAYLPLFFQYVLRGRYATLLEFLPLLKEEIKQAAMEEKADLIPHLLFSIEQCLLHVDKANIGSDELAKTAEMFKEEFDKYKEELAEFKERPAKQEQDLRIDWEKEITESSDDEWETTETSEKELDDDEKMKICSEATEFIKRIRRGLYCNENDAECIKTVIRHRKELAEQWEELANFVVEEHPTREHKMIALDLLHTMDEKVLEQDEKYLRRLIDFIVHAMENIEADSALTIYDSYRIPFLVSRLLTDIGKYEDKLWMIYPILAALLKRAEEEVTSGADEKELFGFSSAITAIAHSVEQLEWFLFRHDELNPHLPRMYTLCKVVQEIYGKPTGGKLEILRKKVSTLAGYMNPVDCGRAIRLRIAREAIIDSEELTKMVEKFKEENKEKLANCKEIIASRQKERAASDSKKNTEDREETSNGKVTEEEISGWPADKNAFVASDALLDCPTNDDVFGKVSGTRDWPADKSAFVPFDDHLDDINDDVIFGMRHEGHKATPGAVEATPSLSD